MPKSLDQSTIIKSIFVTGTMALCIYEGFAIWGVWGLLAGIVVGLLASMGIWTFSPKT
jgi:hypothetical protein